MLTSTLVDRVLADIFSQSLSFLPGPACNEEDVRRNMSGAPLFDGLSDEETVLILSTLPRGASGLYLAEMDKGLSGAKVLQGRYGNPGGRLSKPFVLKLGSKEKVLREVRAMQELVTPFVPGAVPPVYRLGPSSCLLIQELAGLSSTSKVVSLRNFARSHTQGPQVVRRLFAERLNHWYQLSATTTEPKSFNEAFEWYLSKAPLRTGRVVPAEWSALEDWVADETGPPVGDTFEIVDSIRSRSFDTPATIIHGDLHSQNVVVDENTKECWPIDYGWCHDDAPPLIDFVMLECSLKFLAFPMRADLRSMLSLESALSRAAMPTVTVGKVPYAQEIQNVLDTVLEVRRQAVTETGYSFDDYRRGLFLMTFSHANHQGLNRPFVLASMQILANAIGSNV